MKNNRSSLIIILSIAIMAFTACKSKKALVQTNAVDSKLLEQVQRIEKAQPMFNTANVSKMSANVEVGGRKFSTQASCKMRTDSVIHISIQPLLGFEMFKVEIDNDKILAYDKVNRKLYKVTFDYFKTRFGVSIGFSDLQSILSNRFFTVGTLRPDLLKCKQMESVDNLNVIAFFAEELMQKTMINGQDRISKIEINATKSDYKMQVDYSEFAILDTQLFPQQISVQANTAKRNVQFDFKISKAVFNSNISFSTIDPSKYTEADINQLLNK